MRVGIRADASQHIGTGHIMRCLVLAEQLRMYGVEVIFFCHHFPGNLITSINGKGFPVRVFNHSDSIDDLKQNWEKDAEETVILIRQYSRFDYFVVDHYGLDYRWESVVKPFVDRLMVIDDLANRAHYCDSLLDQNLLPNMEKRYQQLVQLDTDLLLGPKYLLLREEFVTAKIKLKRRSSIDRMLVSFGGSDPTNETLKALLAISQIPDQNWQIDIVTGTSNTQIQDLRQFAKLHEKVQLYEQTNRMAELMSEADIAIGAGGTTTWERCYMQLPAITLEVADNQSEILDHLHAKGFLYHLGKNMDVKTVDIREALWQLIYTPQLFQRMADQLSVFRENVDHRSVTRFILKEGADDR
ncbi:UDP-2,4-diacetamido-2,4,6-trideoxy-beta-L-altropyranose hydrolase [Gracilibacillus salitolerans]|uniref:UDP-2,4-diacetamido-2,4, 6-trideoxy-beta-L-altropyranose hydrolase n=1 Tax=Gracilibacillus salitolerans TaxID=2663022 RepID=A0A5Q2TM43_9BACI|nr:UDP-2,4-diacetamido-2,4,6-trideoxy-beta-L-altropyranose hydrolase [Gracilibacillus salitolerans]QGH35221.1 UDP-2,4-diacetamido-2,4,6-trideoxy-beta-L-altropyranose hydrolase [Gracilibacillus salitolerans]